MPLEPVADGAPSATSSRSNVWAPYLGLLRGSPWIYAVVASFLLAAFVGVGVFFGRAMGVEERESLALNDAIARSVAASIEVREEGYLNVLRSYAGRFRFRQSVKHRDATEARVHLRQLQQAFPELDRVLLADPAGIVWLTQPDTPEIYGRSYAGRDWYRGVSAAWQPYLSEVYQTDIGHVPAVDRHGVPGAEPRGRARAPGHGFIASRRHDCRPPDTGTLRLHRSVVQVHQTAHDRQAAGTRAPPTSPAADTSGLT